MESFHDSENFSLILEKFPHCKKKLIWSSFLKIHWRLKDFHKNIRWRAMQQYLTSSNCKPLLRIVPCYMLHSWLKPIEQLLSLSHLFQLKVLLYCKVLEKIVKKLCTYFCIHFSPVSDK